MAVPDCAVCGHSRILTKCSKCGRRVCLNCYVTPYAMCVPCAQAQGLRLHQRILRSIA